MCANFACAPWKKHLPKKPARISLQVSLGECSISLSWPYSTLMTEIDPCTVLQNCSPCLQCCSTCKWVHHIPLWCSCMGTQTGTLQSCTGTHHMQMHTSVMPCPIQGSSFSGMTLLDSYTSSTLEESWIKPFLKFQHHTPNNFLCCMEFAVYTRYWRSVLCSLFLDS